MTKLLPRHHLRSRSFAMILFAVDIPSVVRFSTFFSILVYGAVIGSFSPRNTAFERFHDILNRILSRARSFDCLGGVSRRFSLATGEATTRVKKDSLKGEAGERRVFAFVAEVLDDEDDASSPRRYYRAESRTGRRGQGAVGIHPSR